MALLLLLLAPLVASTTVSPVQKVIELLDDLKSKVEADFANEGKLMEEYTNWCDEEANEKEDAITSSKRSITDFKATIQDATATIGTLTSTIGELTGKISSSEGDLKQAVSIREKEHKDFAAAEKELEETVDSLTRATSVLKKNLGFLQGGNVAKKLGMMASGLQKIVEASWVNEHQKAVLQSLIQSQSGESDEDMDLQPQATAAAYESQSGGILDTIADMQAKAEESLSSTRSEEMNTEHSFQMVKQGLEDEIAVMKKQLSQATLTRSKTEEELHAAQQSLTETETTLAQDEKYLAELKQSCAAKASEWAERQRSAADETAAIEKAKGILSDGVTALVQTSVRVTTTSAIEESSAARKNVVELLSVLSKKFHSFGLVQLSSRARSDPFGKIRGLVETMIARLEKEAAAEATQKAFCDEETSESKAKQADLTGKIDKTSSRMEKAEADKASLSEAVKTLEGELAEMDAGQSEATKMRQEEHAEYLKSSKDFKDSATAVAKAMEVLNEYYNSASFLQVRATTRRSGSRQPEFGGAKSDVGATIVSILEMAEGDFTQMLAEAEAGESEAQGVYDKLVQENAVVKATKQGDIKGKTSEAKQLEVAIGNYKEDKATTGDELDAVLTYLDKLKPQCETKVMSYGDKKAAREKEIEGLKEALDILSKDESFLQVKTSLRSSRRA